ncbi:MAG: hypothetical protein GX973_04785 [Firmicutes bacterium]|nr:hypothetical protein [Bacillota bacterium]
MILINLGGPFALIVMTVFMFLLVPRERIYQLFPVAAIFGSVLGITTYYLLQNVLQAWRFQQMDLLCPAGIPIFMTLAWIPYSIIYFHMLAQYRTRAHNILLILTAAAMPTFYHFLLELNGMFVFHRWPWWGNFFYALIVFNGLGHLVYHRVIAKPGATVG